MHLPKLALFALLTPALSLCTPVQKRADLLQTQSYADFQISDGVAGNALAEVAANFPVEEFRADPAAVSESDLEILKAARKTAEAAETQEGGFNDAIDAAGGKDTPEGQRLQVGKIKNKVLKLELQVLVLEIEQAQGKDRQEKLDAQVAKRDKNAQTDEESAGEESLGVDFQG